MSAKLENPEDEIERWDAMRHGDKLSFGWIYDRYFRLLYNYGKKIGIEDQLLEDSIHNVFVDLWFYHENLSTTTSVRFYLYRSLHRKVNRYISRQPFLNSLDPVPDSFNSSSIPSPEQEIIEEEIHDRQIHQLRRLLNDLSPRQYEALVLRFYDELSFDEIADILDVNAQSARNLVQRGIIQLKQFAKHVIMLSLSLFLC